MTRLSKKIGEKMTVIGSVGIQQAEHRYSQDAVKDIVSGLFEYPDRKMARLLKVFDSALINERQFSVDEHWFYEEHSFAERNQLYLQCALRDSLQAIDTCLSDRQFLHQDIPHDAVDMILFVSSTGIATPSLDSRIMNERPFRPDTQRMPLWGLGCAGGAIGLSHASTWIQANPDKICLLVCTELCSLTFQKSDQEKSNFIGTALFGDGTGVVLLIGEQSPYLQHLKGLKPSVIKTSSHTERNTEEVMGWDVSNTGLKVIFSKSIPMLVETIWKKHFLTFLKQLSCDVSEISSYIVHPGGAKVLQAMESTMAIKKEQLIYSYQILFDHGNMSSATVLYVLREWMKAGVKQDDKSILSALGPGFSSELLLLEWR